MKFLEALRDRVLLSDGGMGTRLFAKGATPGECLEALNLSSPALVREVHEEYRASGADILTTNSFGANAARLVGDSMETKVHDINVAAVRLARSVASGDLFVAGAVGPLGHRAPESSAVFATQIAALAEAGADFILLETFHDLSELRQAVRAARHTCDLPVVAQVSPEEDGALIGGLPTESCATQLAACGADAIGCNCGTTPAAMLQSMERLARCTDLPLAAQPSAGLPFMQDGQLVYPCPPAEFAGIASRMLQHGVRMIGGCCGTGPDHIAAVARIMTGRTFRQNRLVLQTQ